MQALWLKCCGLNYFISWMNIMLAGNVNLNVFCLFSFRNDRMFIRELGLLSCRRTQIKWQSFEHFKSIWKETVMPAGHVVRVQRKYEYSHLSTSQYCYNLLLLIALETENEIKTNSQWMLHTTFYYWKWFYEPYTCILDLNLFNITCCAVWRYCNQSQSIAHRRQQNSIHSKTTLNNFRNLLIINSEIWKCFGVLFALHASFCCE